MRKIVTAFRWVNRWPEGDFSNENGLKVVSLLLSPLASYFLNLQFFKCYCAFFFLKNDELRNEKDLLKKRSRQSQLASQLAKKKLYIYYLLLFFVEVIRFFITCFHLYVTVSGLLTPVRSKLQAMQVVKSIQYFFCVFSFRLFHAVHQLSRFQNIIYWMSSSTTPSQTISSIVYLPHTLYW